MKLPVALLLTLCLAGCATAIPGLGLPTSGVVVDKATGAPISGAYVVMHVDALAPFQGFQCNRMQIVKSAADGTFATSPWAELPLGQRQEQYYVYAPVYALDSITAALRLNMTRQADANERLRHLTELGRLLSCLGDPSTDVIHVWQLMAAEVEGLRVTAGERESFVRSMNKRIEVERKRLTGTARRNE